MAFSDTTWLSDSFNFSLSSTNATPNVGGAGPGAASAAMPVLEDLVGWSRMQRQELYAEVLKAHSSEKNRMTPTMVKEQIEKQGMTFAFVGQDMAAMRTTWADTVGVEGRGQYWWKNPEAATAPPLRKKSRLAMDNEVAVMDLQME